MAQELTRVVLKEEVTIDKFMGDSTDPIDLVERVHLVDGKVTWVETYRHGMLIKHEEKD